MFEIIQNIIMDFVEFLPFYVLIFIILTFIGRVVRR